MDQGFTKPNRNAASWDSDLNANFTLLERGYVIPMVVGTTAVQTGTLVQVQSTTAVGSLPTASIYGPNIPGCQGTQPAGLCLQAGSPGNTVYTLAYGALQNFTAYSGHIPPGAFFGASVDTPGWVTNSFERTNMFVLGRAWDHGGFEFFPMPRLPVSITKTYSGIAHCASGALGVFSFQVDGIGFQGYNDLVRVRSNSCDNYRVTFYANSARTAIIYDTAINSGNLGVRTIDMIDAAMWPFSTSNVHAPPQWGAIYGAVEVLSSAATAINSQAFQVNVDFIRNR